MKLPETLFASSAVLRRVLAMGALASAMALGTAACEGVPNIGIEQGDDGDSEEDGGGGDDEGGEDDGGDENEGDDEGDDEDGGDDGDDEDDN